MTAAGEPSKPLRVAIVGAGPAGFYAAEAPARPARDCAIEVDMFDRLPTPFGLVRAGVAPDHPKIKSRHPRYEKTAGARGLTASSATSTVGRDVTAEELAERYHAVICAYGAGTDRQLGIPGEDLPGSHAATEFVAWYNGHPDFADHEFDLGCERVVVIGNGNVAADVARMLALPRDELEGTDTADHAIDALADSSVREIVVLGRRGPAQAAFTNPEVRELGELTDADVVIDPADRGARRGQPRPSSTPTTPTRPTARTSRSSPSSPSASPRASRSASSCGSCAPRWRSRATAGSSGSSSASTSSTSTNPGAVRARGTGETRDDRVRAGAALDRLPRHRDRGLPYDAAPRRDPERGAAA